ncbi:MAG: Tetratricopeptide repeat protein [Verrucomicrobiales bacterium]|nr:Tetratricopeptide repeat protein [Verrucomicrobiales bacterium]
MKTTITAILLLVALPAWAEIHTAREAMKQQQPAKAGEVISAMLKEKPEDLWLQYDAGVVAYAQKDYDKAEKIWQELASKPLPPKLQDQVWMQIGNVSFRLGEAQVTTSPEQALPQWEESREALRVAVNSNKKNKLAENNLTYVESELAKLHAKLAKRLLQDAKKERENKKQIEKLQAALDHQVAAQNLQPKDEELKKDVKETEHLLAEKFNDKAVREEKSADNLINKPAPNGWERKYAEEQLNTALADFQEAKMLNAENKEAQEGEKRVQEKLADLLTKNAEQLANDARQEVEQQRPNEAIEKFEKALDKFEQAQNLKPDHKEAKAGEAQVKKELEQLHLDQAEQLAEKGDKDAAKRPAEAAEEMMQALDHLQQAQGLNPDNQEIPPKISELEKKLPPLLMALGEKEQQQADKAEPKSLQGAVQHLEKAATAFQMAQELQKDNQAAQQAEDKVQDRLAKLRNQIAQTAQAPKPPKQKGEEEENNQTFQSLLAQFKKDDKQKQYEQQRNGQQEKYDPEKVRNYKNW